MGEFVRIEYLGVLGEIWLYCGFFVLLCTILVSKDLFEKLCNGVDQLGPRILKLMADEGYRDLLSFCEAAFFGVGFAEMRDDDKGDFLDEEASNHSDVATTRRGSASRETDSSSVKAADSRAAENNLEPTRVYLRSQNDRIANDSISRIGSVESDPTFIQTKRDLPELRSDVEPTVDKYNRSTKEVLENEKRLDKVAAGDGYSNATRTPTQAAHIEGTANTSWEGGLVLISATQMRNNSIPRKIQDGLRESHAEHSGEEPQSDGQKSGEVPSPKLVDASRTQIPPLTTAVFDGLSPIRPLPDISALSKQEMELLEALGASEKRKSECGELVRSKTQQIRSLEEECAVLEEKKHWYEELIKKKMETEKAYTGHIRFLENDLAEKVAYQGDLSKSLQQLDEYLAATIARNESLGIGKGHGMFEEIRARLLSDEGEENEDDEEDWIATQRPITYLPTIPEEADSDVLMSRIASLEHDLARNEAYQVELDQCVEKLNECIEQKAMQKEGIDYSIQQMMKWRTDLETRISSLEDMMKTLQDNCTEAEAKSVALETKLKQKNEAVQSLKDTCPLDSERQDTSVDLTHDLTDCSPVGISWSFSSEDE